MTHDQSPDGKTPGFLNDAQLARALGGSAPLIKNCQPVAEDRQWQGAHTQVQPSSIDLWPECFYTRSGAGSTQQSHVSLAPGGAVLIHTKEEFDLPGDVMGFVFTPTHWSLRGFFSPSVGHIDPGYKGKLTMVGINMGGRELELSVTQTHPIATVVLYRMATASVKDRAARNPQSHEAPEIIIGRFAEDFGNFRSQAGQVAKEAVLAEAAKWFPGALIVTGFVLATQFLINTCMGYYGLQKDVSEMQGKLSVLERGQSSAHPAPAAAATQPQPPQQQPVQPLPQVPSLQAPTPREQQRP